MQKLILTLIFLLALCSLRAQLYGTASTGGKGGGTISVLNPAKATLKAAFSFDTQDGYGGAFLAKLTQAKDGKLYGMTQAGGSNLGGTIFCYNPATGAYAKLFDFDGYNTGSAPYGYLIQATDGKLYGMTNNGGQQSRGTIFSFDPADSSYTNLYNFNTTDGAFPYGSLLQAADGKLYGMANEGGKNNGGVIFCYDISKGTYNKLLDFDDTNAKSAVGEFIQEPDGKLYATTSRGGLYNAGVIFSFNPAGSVFTKLVDFDITNGSSPAGHLTKAPNGNFYGITAAGGANNLGALFSYNPATNTYTNLHNFDLPGYHPQKQLTLAADGKLYGETSQGGVDGFGVLFSYNINSAVYTSVYSFNRTTGAYPNGGLTQASDGKLYGITTGGGASDQGVVFSYNLSTNAYTNLRNFGVNNTGSLPFGGLVQGPAGKLYGMTTIGGAYGSGVLYSFDANTSVYTKLVDFKYHDGLNPSVSEGNSPYGSLLLAADGNLYGTTLGGGVNGGGVIFSFNPSTLKYTKLKDLTNAGGNAPYGNLIQVKNGLFYGMAQGGGANYTGTIFSFDAATGDYTKLYDFGDADGAYPNASLTLAKDGKMYGVTSGGGINGWGVLFVFNPADNTYKKLMNFDGSTGTYPLCTLVQAGDNKLYGMTSDGGAGGIFSYDPATSTFEKIKGFTGDDGYYPQGSLTAGSDGKLYGMTRQGGSHDYGVSFSLDPITKTFTKIQDFDGTNGKYPEYTFFTETPAGALPLSLLSFTAARKGSTNLLSWVTTQEINTSHFDVERSGTGRNFASIGTIQALNNSRQQNDYTFTDAQPLNAVNYYRLKMIDKDGKFTYSGIRVVNRASNVNLAIYPNPVHEMLKISFTTTKATTAQIDIISNDGKTVYTQKLQLPNGASIHNINIAALSSGNYVVRCTAEEGQMAMKMVKE